MKDRLSKFIREEQLTPSKLAEIVGVQPSSISHLLSGRNKPGFDFISNLLRRFPHLNPYWLILGNEPMYNSQAIRASVSDMHGETKPGGGQELFAESTNSSDDRKVESRPLNNPRNELPKMALPITSSKLPESATNCHTQSQLQQSNIVKPTDNTQIERVIIFLSDGTFTSYCPK